MPLPHGTIRPVNLTGTQVSTGVRRVLARLDAWTLVAFNPPADRGRGKADLG